jgi:hypothetical protein
MMTEYEAWIERVRGELRALPDDPRAQGFLDKYRTYKPFTFSLPDWPALEWTLPYLNQRIGNRTVQVQGDRVADPDYECNKDAHHRTMTVGALLDSVEHGLDNDTYLTANNFDVPESRELMLALADDFRPVPPYLTDAPQSAFLWLGRDTQTPVHHDTTMNLMCQLMGTKQVRVAAPEHWSRIKHRHGVHSWLNWLDDVPFEEFWLTPGVGLFLPAGWWHCVLAYGVSCTAVFTNIIWGNEFYRTFRPVA